MSIVDDLKKSLDLKKGDDEYINSNENNNISSIRSDGNSKMNRADNLHLVLKNFQNGSPDVEAAALISEDGLTIASALPEDLDKTRIGGMSATLHSLGTRAAVELRRGTVKEVIVRGEQGYTVLLDAGRGVLLLAIANENASLGLIFFDMRETINKIKDIL
ncbi:MAG: roadblock/LC7 domain-containing protein [Methylococcaceae bacterium]|nr:roadblock/LC7 domain-containing protein [Methylococcaceae bacterium]